MNAKEQKNGAPNGADQPQVRYEDPREIKRSPFNRLIESGPALEEMVDSVRTHGIIEPLIVREVDYGTETCRAEPFELIAGERRWAAARRLKLAEVPIIVRQADDLEVIELQTIENDQREDLSPVERAEKYAQLLEHYERDGKLSRPKAIEKLAERVGKKRSNVYEILTLIKLPPEVRKIVNTGRLPASHAALLVPLAAAPEMQAELARVIAPDEKLLETEDDHRGALRKLEERTEAGYVERDSGGIMSFREAKSLVQSHKNKLGARAKWLELAEKHRKAGGKVLTTEEQEQIVGSYGQIKAPYYSLAGTTTDYSKNYLNQSFGKLIKPKHMPAKTLSRDSDWEPIWLIDRKEAAAAIEKSGHKKVSRRIASSSSGRGNDDYAARQRARQELEAKMAPVEKAVRDAIVKAAGQPKPKFPWLIFFSELLEYNDDLAQRHGWKKKTVAHEAVKLNEQGRFQLLVEHLLTCDRPGFDTRNKRWDPAVVSLAKYYGVDVDKMTKELTAPTGDGWGYTNSKRKKPQLHYFKDGLSLCKGTPADRLVTGKPGPNACPTCNSRVNEPAAPVIKATGKGAVLSTAGRKRLGELMKKRWADRRKKGAVK